MKEKTRQEQWRRRRRQEEAFSPAEKPAHPPLVHLWRISGSSGDERILSSRARACARTQASFAARGDKNRARRDEDDGGEDSLICRRAGAVFSPPAPAGVKKSPVRRRSEEKGQKPDRVGGCWREMQLPTGCYCN